MAYRRVGTYYGNPWANQIATVPSGHFALFYPGNANVPEGDRNHLILYTHNGIEVARQHGAIGSFDLTVDANGHIVARVTRFGEAGVPVDEWDTGVLVALTPPTTTTTTTPAPAPAGTQLDRIEAGVAAIKAKVGA